MYSSRKFWLWFEFAILFVGVPVALIFYPTRWLAHLILWRIAIYAITTIAKMPLFSWRHLWHGEGWTVRQKQQALIRFALATTGVVVFTHFILAMPLFSFPLHRPKIWLLVMILYPILSALPQELVFRGFFFRRYQEIIPSKMHMIVISALLFSLVHVFLHNWVAPSLCLVAGTLFAWSYSQHRSLKWATIEHGAYGCMIFTVGIGTFFFIHGLQR